MRLRSHVRTTNRSFQLDGVLRTLGVLPLRFVSLLGLGLWIRYFVIIFEPVEWQLFVFGSLVFLVPAAYLCFSAYVTFKSPDTAVLLIAGCATNVPVAGIALSAYATSSQGSWKTEPNLYVSAICISLVISWVIFLVARLGERTNEPLSILSKDPPRVEQPDHHCLGSRFVEWQERYI